MYLTISQISFRSGFSGTISEKYTDHPEDTVAVLGSSNSIDDINSRLKNTPLDDKARKESADKMLSYMDLCSNSTKALVLSGKNLVHGGCGYPYGMMGAAYESGAKYSRIDEDGKPAQNLAILTDPSWGNEDPNRCVVIATAKGEADRIEGFAQVADNILIFPGGTGTLQEAATFISENHYGKPEDRKNIILVGKEFFKGISEQYDTLYKSGLIKCPPEELFTVVDSKEEILEIINGEKNN